MTNFSPWQSGTAVLTALGLSTSMTTLLVTAASAQTRFSDVSADFWAEQFIIDLANRGIIAGFPDGSFHPNDPVTRAQYAAMVRRAFNQATIRKATAFVDVPNNHWAAPAIDTAYEMGFLTGYPGNYFSPNQNIPRAQVLVSLANGLNYETQNPAAVNLYTDARVIPDYAIDSIAAATENQLVVNYPNVQQLNPNRTATRADVAAFIYQALVSQGQVATVNSPYIVGGTATTPNTVGQFILPAGASIPVVYGEAEKILLLPDETVPLTVTIPRTVYHRDNRVVIPRNSVIMGELRPSGNGTQFVAEELVLTTGQRFPITASSERITKIETIRKGANAGRIVTGAILGSGAATLISGVTGDRKIEALEVLAGTAVGSVAGALVRDKVDLISVDSNTDLELVLETDLQIPVQ